MKKEKKTTDLFVKLIKDVPTSLQSDGSLTSIMDADNFYNDLIKRGVIKKRGNTLMGINEQPFFNINVNQAQK